MIWHSQSTQSRAPRRCYIRLRLGEEGPYIAIHKYAAAVRSSGLVDLSVGVYVDTGRVHRTCVRARSECDRRRDIERRDDIGANPIGLARLIPKRRGLIDPEPPSVGVVSTIPASKPLRVIRMNNVVVGQICL